MQELRSNFDPDEYQHAKKQLKKAVLECYRGLEVLSNYRTLNLIGFRKALKKFEKVTNIPAQQAYTREKIEPSAFASGKSVDAMVREMEELFAARFARGDKKRAMARLRGGFHHKSHHFSTFRTGLTLGLAVPALVGGIYQSFQQDTRRAIPSWDGLLFVYAIFFIPTLFSLLVGINLLVWSRSRINYIFIFELDLRTRLDHRVYFEAPAFLLSLLCYAFWLSFSRIGSSNVAPTTWPLLWLALTALVLLDPLPILFRPSRWWLVKNVIKLLTSGMHRVEFTDFWMGHGMDQTWRRCTNGPKWGISFVLASLPLLFRLVQSVKRWVDSRLITHLINGGKYGSGILMYLFYFMWREHGGGRGSHFVVWCIFATNYSLYAASWDFLMDWSVLRPHATYPLLRSELLYTNCIPLYYVAIITNILIRFIWVLYIPQRGPDFVLRTFIAGMLEMLRRWQWNFFRLENEHLGNVDQYRVTREVPLPYSFDDPSHDSDGDDDDEDKRSRVSISSVSWRRAQKPHGRGSGVIRENIDLN
ncbi:Phosphate transporter PHO1 [Grifola frondosa]|uniref:Phosphate transporter PHO1 n=1 Tax=Grifola frondosa TaxID=5627 RepID=A0A1C7LSH0_GRIFR|nr:Phosphate transporter PHO1 [Grifola frondosa]